MKRSSPPLAPDTLKKSTAKTARNMSLADIEETETSLWLLEQLNRIQKLLVEHGADDELLEAVEYLIEDNDQWVSPKIEALLGSTRTGTA